MLGPGNVFIFLKNSPLNPECRQTSPPERMRSWHLCLDRFWVAISTSIIPFRWVQAHLTSAGLQACASKIIIFPIIAIRDCFEWDLKGICHMFSFMARLRSGLLGLRFERYFLFMELWLRSRFSLSVIWIISFMLELLDCDLDLDFLRVCISLIYLSSFMNYDFI